MRALIWASCIATLALAVVGCRSPGSHPDWCEDARTRVSAESEHGSAPWTASLQGFTDEPPRVGDGYVLVRTSCGYAVLDLTDGDVVKTGEETGAVGVADRFLYLVNRKGDDSVVESVPVVGHSVDSLVATITASYPGDPDVSAYVEHGYLYIAASNNLSRTNTRVSRLLSHPHERWDASLPTLDQPTFTPVGDLVVVTSSDGSVYGLSRANLRVRWRTTVPDVAPSYTMSVEVRDGFALVTARPSVEPPTVVRIRPSDGRILGVALAPTPGPEVAPLLDSGEGWEVAVTSSPPPEAY